jgi:glycosyltransferase involved in cell wall biosynthesis
MGGIATYFQTLMRSSLPDKVNLRFVQTSSQTRDFATSGNASWANAVSALKDIARFARAAWSHRPQVSHIATAFGLSFVKNSVCVVAARLVGSRVLLHPHCSLEALYTGRPGWWQWYFRQVIRMTDGVIALSEERNQVSEIVPGTPVYSLVNAVDLDLYQPVAQAHLAQARASGPAHVLYLGYLGQAKGTFDLVEAARLVLANRQDVVFDLVGGDLTPGEKALVQQKVAASGLDGQVHVDPPAYDEAKLAHLRQADIFVYPSYHEGMPMAVLEAMACACRWSPPGRAGCPTWFMTALMACWPNRAGRINWRAPCKSCSTMNRRARRWRGSAPGWRETAMALNSMWKNWWSRTRPQLETIERTEKRDP